MADDNLGTPRDDVDNTGTLINHSVFSAFGQDIYDSNPAVVNWNGFAGGHIDPTTGLVNDYHRWYDPSIGAWLSQDPRGFAGRDTSLGRYAENRPTGFTDPTGLEMIPPVPNPSNTPLGGGEPPLESWYQTMALNLADNAEGFRMVFVNGSTSLDGTTTDGAVIYVYDSENNIVAQMVVGSTPYNPGNGAQWLILPPNQAKKSKETAQVRITQEGAKTKFEMETSLAEGLSGVAGIKLNIAAQITDEMGKIKPGEPQAAMSFSIPSDLAGKYLAGKERAKKDEQLYRYYSYTYEAFKQMQTAVRQKEHNFDE